MCFTSDLFTFVSSHMRLVSELYVPTVVDLNQILWKNDSPLTKDQSVGFRTDLDRGLEKMIFPFPQYVLDIK